MKIFKLIKNKYLLATLFFVVWVLFFDHNNLFTHLQYRKQLNALQDSKKYYQEQIDKTQKDIEQIKSNPKWMEKIAREQYLMKKDSEDVFLIKEK